MSLITLTPFLSRILVTFVCLFIFFLAYPSQYFLLQNRAYAPWWSSVHAAWFNFCVASIWVAYYRSVNTDPGRLPDGWLPDGVDDLVEGTAKEGDDSSEHKQRKLWGKSVGRWCKKCQGWKPPRCHHCRKCGRCVLRMDHHCGCFDLYGTFFCEEETPIKHMKQAPGLTTASATSTCLTSSVLSAGQPTQLSS